MSNADLRHRYAGECRALAEQVSSENQRRTLLDIAQEWESLAHPPAPSRPGKSTIDNALVAFRPSCVLVIAAVGIRFSTLRAADSRET
jgi:hypothetical protein